MYQRIPIFYSNFLQILVSFSSPFFLRLRKCSRIKAKFMPKVSLAKWGFTIFRAKKFSARRAWIFLTVDGITVTRGEPACAHVCTHIGASLYISANLIPFLSALWERMDTLHSLVLRAFAGSELKEHYYLNSVRIFFFHSLRAHLCAFALSFSCAYNMSQKRRQFVGKICALMNLELTLPSRKFKVLLFSRCNRLKFLTSCVLEVKFLLPKNLLRMNPGRIFHINFEIHFVKIFNIGYLKFEQRYERITFSLRQMIALQFTSGKFVNVSLILDSNTCTDKITIITDSGKFSLGKTITFKSVKCCIAHFSWQSSKITGEIPFCRDKSQRSIRRELLFWPKRK